MIDTSVDIHKVELVRSLVSSGYGDAVRHMLLGVSKYSVPAVSAELAYPAAFENRDSKGFHLMTWVHAHLEFTAKYGATATEAQENEKHFFAYPEAYEEWLSYGAPGVLFEELQACAEDLRKSKDAGSFSDAP